MKKRVQLFIIHNGIWPINAICEEKNIGLFLKAIFKDNIDLSDNIIRFPFINDKHHQYFFIILDSKYRLLSLDSKVPSKLLLIRIDINILFMKEADYKKKKDVDIINNYLEEMYKDIIIISKKEDKKPKKTTKKEPKKVEPKITKETFEKLIKPAIVEIKPKDIKKSPKKKENPINYVDKKRVVKPTPKKEEKKPVKKATKKEPIIKVIKPIPKKIKLVKKNPKIVTKPKTVKVTNKVKITKPIKITKPMPKKVKLVKKNPKVVTKPKKENKVKINNLKVVKKVPKKVTVVKKAVPKPKVQKVSKPVVKVFKPIPKKVKLVKKTPKPVKDNKTVTIKNLKVSKKLPKKTKIERKPVLKPKKQEKKVEQPKPVPKKEPVSNKDLISSTPNKIHIVVTLGEATNKVVTLFDTKPKEQKKKIVAIKPTPKNEEKPVKIVAIKPKKEEKKVEPPKPVVKTSYVVAPKKEIVKKEEPVKEEKPVVTTTKKPTRVISKTPKETKKKIEAKVTTAKKPTLSLPSKKKEKEEAPVYKASYGRPKKTHGNTLSVPYIKKEENPLAKVGPINTRVDNIKKGKNYKINPESNVPKSLDTPTGPIQEPVAPAKDNTPQTIEYTILTPDNKVMYHTEVLCGKPMSVIDLLLQSGLNVKNSNGFIESINGVNNQGMSGWVFEVNDAPVMVPASQYIVNPSEQITWKYVDFSMMATEEKEEEHTRGR